MKTAAPRAHVPLDLDADDGFWWGAFAPGHALRAHTLIVRQRQGHDGYGQNLCWSPPCVPPGADEVELSSSRAQQFTAAQRPDPRFDTFELSLCHQGRSLVVEGKLYYADILGPVLEFEQLEYCWAWFDEAVTLRAQQAMEGATANSCRPGPAPGCSPIAVP